MSDLASALMPGTATAPMPAQVLNNTSERIRGNEQPGYIRSDSQRQPINQKEDSGRIDRAGSEKGGKEDFQKILEKRLSGNENADSAKEKDNTVVKSKDKKPTDEAILVGGQLIIEDGSTPKENVKKAVVLTKQAPTGKNTIKIADIQTRASSKVKTENNTPEKVETKVVADGENKDSIKTQMKQSAAVKSGENKIAADQANTAQVSKKEVLTKTTDAEAAKQPVVEKVGMNPAAEVKVQDLKQSIEAKSEEKNTTEQDIKAQSKIVHLEQKTAISDKNEPRQNNIGDNKQNTKTEQTKKFNELEAEIKSNNTQSGSQAESIKAAQETSPAVNVSTNIKSTPVTSNIQSSNNVTGVDNADVRGTERISPHQQVIDNISDLRPGPNQEVTITLNPAELGRVRMRFQQVDGEINGKLEVEKAPTRYEIEKHLPQVVASLQANGIQIRRIEVVQDQRQPGQQQNGPPDQNLDPHTQRHFDDYSARDRQSYQDSDSSLDSGATPSGSTASGRPSGNISDDAINVYI